MELQSYQQQDRTWHHVLDYERRDDEQIRLHAACLGRIGQPMIIGFRVLDDRSRLVAHWNPSEGWVNHKWSSMNNSPTTNSNKNIKPQKDHHSTRTVKRAAKQKRPCLRCKKNFISEGAHNRLCRICRTLPEPPVTSSLAI